MLEFRVGDKVEVINWGVRYEFFQELADQMKLQKWGLGAPREKNAKIVYTVVAKMMHPRSTVPVVVYGISSPDAVNDHILEGRGLTYAVETPVFKVGSQVRVTNWGAEYTVFTAMAEVFGLKDWVSPSTLGKDCSGLIFVVRDIKIHCVDFITNIYLIQPVNVYSTYYFMFDSTGLASLDDKPQIKERELIRFTSTYRLRFRNGEEIECPAPNPEKWEEYSVRTFEWPVKHILSGNDLGKYIVLHDQGCCWINDFLGRILDGKPQILWARSFRNIIKSDKVEEPERYQTRYEFL